MQGDGPQATNLKSLYEEAAVAEVLFNRMEDRRDLLRGTWIFPQQTFVEEPSPEPAGSGPEWEAAGSEVVQVGRRKTPAVRWRMQM